MNAGSGKVGQSLREELGGLRPQPPNDRRARFARAHRRPGEDQLCLRSVVPPHPVAAPEAALARSRTSSIALSGAVLARIAAVAWAPSPAIRASATPSISARPAAGAGRRLTAGATGRKRPTESFSQTPS